MTSRKDRSRRHSEDHPPTSDSAFREPTDQTPDAGGGDSGEPAGPHGEIGPEDRVQPQPAEDIELLREKARERDAFLDLLQRTRAEFENYQKRVRRDIENERRYAVLPMVRDLLPVLDNLERALQAGEAAHDGAQLLEGIALVVRQFEDVLAQHDVRPIEAVGRPLDPHLHETVGQQTTTEHPELTVLEEVQRGYELHDRVVRPSKVIVAQAPSEPKPAPEDGQSGGSAPAGS